MEITRNVCPLPEDTIFEILTRVSFQTLQQCRLILTKNWKQTTYESCFVQQHCHRTKTVLGFYIHVSRRLQRELIFVRPSDLNPDQSLSLSFLPERVWVRAVSNQSGLLLCQSESSRGRRPDSFYVCKPTTKEWNRIPNPRTRFWSIAYAMAVLHPPDSTKFHYKIVRFSEPRVQAVRYSTMLCEVYDSDRGNWKPLENIRFPDHPYIQSSTTPVYCNGAFHWMRLGRKQIFAFDMGTQKWKLISVPKEVLNDDCSAFNITLIQLEGELALFYEKHDQREIWVMEDYLEQNWKLREVVTTKKRLVNLYTSDIAVYFENCLWYNKIIWYNFRTGTSRATIVGDKAFGPYVFRFESDCEPFFTSVW